LVNKFVVTPKSGHGSAVSLPFNNAMSQLFDNFLTPQSGHGSAVSLPCNNAMSRLFDNFLTPQSGDGNAVSLPLMFVGTRQCRVLGEYGKMTQS